MSKKNKEIKMSEEPIPKTVLWLTACLILVLWSCFPLLLSYLFSGDASFVNKGEFGDSFGVLNTLFSGFTLLFVIIAVVLQQKELKAATEALEGANAAAFEQIETQEIQRFENTFFNFLDFYIEQRKKIISDLPSGGIDRLYDGINTSIMNLHPIHDKIVDSLRHLHELFDLKVEIIKFIDRDGYEKGITYIKTLKSLSTAREKVLFKCYISLNVSDRGFKDICIQRYNFWENNRNLAERFRLNEENLNKLDEEIGW